MNQIIYNLNSIRAPITGIGRYAIELLKGGLNVKSPHPVEIAVVSGGRLHQHYSTQLLLQHLEQSPRPAGNWRRLIGAVPYTRRLYRYMDARRFAQIVNDRVTKNTVFHDTNYTPAQIACKKVTTVYDLSHSSHPETHPRHRVAYLNQFFDRLAASDETIITISNSIRDELMHEYNINTDRVHAVPLAADRVYHPRSQSQCANFLSQLGLRFDSYILCVGTLEPRKNLMRLLAAHDSLPVPLKKRYPLVIAGHYGWKSAQFEHKLAARQKAGTVIRLGFVSQNVLPSLYAGAAVFAYPSLYEGFGLPLLEAMQSGTATITSNRGALAEVAGNGAMLVDPTDADDIASQLEKLLQDDSQRALFARNGLERAQLFSWTETVAKTHKIYHDL